MRTRTTLLLHILATTIPLTHARFPIPAIARPAPPIEAPAFNAAKGGASGAGYAGSIGGLRLDGNAITGSGKTTLTAKRESGLQESLEKIADAIKEGVGLANDLSSALDDDDGDDNDNNYYNPATTRVRLTVSQTSGTTARASTRTTSPSPSTTLPPNAAACLSASSIYASCSAAHTPFNMYGNTGPDFNGIERSEQASCLCYSTFPITTATASMSMSMWQWLPQRWDGWMDQCQRFVEASYTDARGVVTATAGASQGVVRSAVGSAQGLCKGAGNVFAAASRTATSRSSRPAGPTAAAVTATGEGCARGGVGRWAWVVVGGVVGFGMGLGQL